MARGPWQDLGKITVTRGCWCRGETSNTILVPAAEALSPPTSGKAPRGLELEPCQTGHSVNVPAGPVYLRHL